MAPKCAMLFVACLIGAQAAGLVAVEEETLNANPIRRVVGLLQGMANKIEAEGANEKKLFDEFMCYCKKQRAESAQAIAETTGKDPQMVSDIKESIEKVKQLKLDIATAHQDIAAAQAAMGAAKDRRAKQNKEFVAAKAELDTNIAAMAKSIPALEKGMGGSFIQSQSGMKMALLKAVSGAQEVSELDKDSVTAFLSTTDNAPSSGEIVGILKTINEDYVKNLKSIESEEAEQSQLFEELMASKTKQAKSCKTAIEKKILQTGQLSVNIVNMKGDVAAAERAKAANEKFAAELDKSCNARVAESDAAVKARGEELVAIADTIKILNDDDALDLFKKTLPSASFLQVKASMAQQKKSVLAIIAGVPRQDLAPELDFLSLSVRGRKANFGKLNKMIDGMVAILKQQAADDKSQIEYCQVQIDMARGKAKDITREIGDASHEIAEQAEVAETAAEEVKAIQAKVQSEDESVKQATAMRQAEHNEYVETSASNKAAKELLGVAKDRLNKFYNPGAAKSSGNFVQIKQHSQLSSGEACRSVVGMLDKLIKELGKEMLTSKMDEEYAQKDYERMVDDSSEKKAADAEAIREKKDTLAEAEGSKADFEETSATKTQELSATKKYSSDLHSECDWLMANANLRKQSRKEQAEQLGSAKDVLAGADVSLLQSSTRTHKQLRGA